MKCPHCSGSGSRVIDTRGSGERIRRRRQCLSCHERFTTYERIALSNPTVVKRDGRHEEFDRDKLMLGVRKACAKRPISMENLEKLVDQVEADVYRLGKTEISSHIIGDLVMKRLKGLDDLAYILFASVYLPLTDLESMKKEVDRLLERQSEGAWDWDFYESEHGKDATTEFYQAVQAVAELVKRRGWDIPYNLDKYYTGFKLGNKVVFSVDWSGTAWNLRLKLPEDVAEDFQGRQWKFQRYDSSHHEAVFRPLQPDSPNIKEMEPLFVDAYKYISGTSR